MEVDPPTEKPKEEPGEVQSDDDNDEAKTCFVGNLSNEVTEEILYELFLQAGPIVEIRIPVDRETKKQKSFGFVLYRHKCAVEYACNIFRGTKLFGRELKIRNRKGDDAVGNTQQGLERLSGYRQGADGGGRGGGNNMNHMMPQMMMMNSPPMMSAGMNPSKFMAMGEQMIAKLAMNNPFGGSFAPYSGGQSGLGGINSLNDQRQQRDAGMKDRGGYRGGRDHGMKPYDRRRNGNFNDNNRGGGRDRRERSRSRDRRRRSRSRDRQQNNKRRR